MTLSQVAKIKVKDGHQAEFEAVARRLVAATNANEPGCLTYTLNKGDDPLIYVMLERYKDEEAINAHRASEHFRTIGRELGAHLAGPPEVVRYVEIA